MSLATYFLAKYIKKQIVERRTRRNKKIGFSTDTSEPIDLTRYTGTLGDDADGELGLKLPLFEFSTIAGTTNNFDDSCKLGEGGFGPVYKGKLPKGQGIAVKRLSKRSVQGLEEFMSEVILISNLQHRNLVSLLGCCIDGEEKLLLYELLPNKSLDSFLFDAKKKELLDWPRRYNIVEGIARGLLYLHRDSRLRIIHRDLKAANILLDEHFNAKISDFGLARMFCGDQIEATTQKVIGTFGYMSPEYAMDGHFSEKSDVFSFGVLLLEIVSGKRNINHLDREHYTNLLGYTWTLWNDNKVYELVDPSLSNSMSMQEVLKCIHVGLLCVQEYPCDRPTMSLVISMLNTDAILPTPKQVAFYGKRSHSELTSYSEGTEICSVNHLIVTNLDCR